MKIVTISGNIELLSGLHIGGGDDTMKIGGIDNGVIKDRDGKPYIPGSSLKGKMRSLLELNNRLVFLPDIEGEPFSSNFLDKVALKDEKNAINLLKLFGDKEGEFGITRAIFADCRVIDEEDLFEAKYENSINRQTGTASNPRQTERVSAGVEFEFEIKIKVLDEDSQDDFIEMIKKGIKLIENDYLGGNGSRGYGRVRFNYEVKDEII